MSISEDLDMYRNRFKMIIIVRVCLFSINGCSLKHPYVGKRFNTDNWLKYSSGKKYVIKGRFFKYEFTISNTNVDSEYLFEGTMDGSRGSAKSIGHIVTRDSAFYLLLAKDGVIIDAISFFPRGTDILQKLPFKKTFKSAPFDSMIITGKLSVRG